MFAIRNTETLDGSGVGKRSAVIASRALSFILGVVLVVASLLKAHALAYHPYAIADPWLASTSTALPILLVEWCVGMWMMSGYRAHIVHRIAIVAFGLFAAASAYKAVSGESVCGCFGTAFSVHPWAMFNFDLLAMGGLVVTRSQVAHATTLPSSLLGQNLRLPCLAVSVAALTAMLFGLAFHEPQFARLTANGSIVGAGEDVEVETRDWVGRNCPLLPHIDIGNRLSEGRWTLLLYRNSCRHCRELLADISKNDSAHMSEFAVIELPPVRLADASQHTVGRLASAYNWYVRTPTMIFLDEGRVEWVEERVSDSKPVDISEGRTGKNI